MAAQTMVRADPKATLLVHFYGTDAVVGKTILRRVNLKTALLYVVAVQTIIGAYPQLAVILLGDAAGSAIVQAVLAKKVGPTLFFYVKTANTHGGGGIQSLAIG